MKLRSMLAVLVMAFSMFSYGQQSAPEQILVNKADLPPAIVAELESKQKIEQYGEYVGLGRELGVAVNESLAAVTEQTAKFAETKLGKFTMAIVAYKVIGNDLAHFFFGAVFFTISTIIWLWSYYKMVIPHRVLITDSKTDGKKYNIVNQGSSPDSSITHAVFAIGIVIATCIMIFTA